MEKNSKIVLVLVVIVGLVLSTIFFALLGRGLYRDDEADVVGEGLQVVLFDNWNVSFKAKAPLNISGCYCKFVGYSQGERLFFWVPFVNDTVCVVSQQDMYPKGAEGIFLDNDTVSVTLEGNGC